MTHEFAIRDIALFERALVFTSPFRFGVATVESAPQAFVRVEIEMKDRQRVCGATAEMMMPKWFDKRPEKTPAQTVSDLRRSLLLARAFYLSKDRRDTAFGHHGAHYEAQMDACAREGIAPLAALYGPAQIDKAILDALLRAAGTGVFAGIGANIMGLNASLTPDLSNDNIDDYLKDATPLTSVELRHTVGMRDELSGPAGLGAIGARTGCRYYKLKLAGDVQEDCLRLAAIGAALESISIDCKITLDANEQYGSPAPLRELLAGIANSPQLQPISRRLLYVEQPFPRELTFEHRLTDLPPVPFIIDEADSSYDAFPRATVLGYSGVSSKSCKGLYKSILNAVRARVWNKKADGRYFLAAEDLTCQAGLAVQQDTALAAFLGIPHAERNGHHYGKGFGDAPSLEAEAFLQGHPDFYRRNAGKIELAIENGSLSTASLSCPGFASAVHPHWDSLSPLKDTTPAPEEQIP